MVICCCILKGLSLLKVQDMYELKILNLFTSYMLMTFQVILMYIVPI